MEDYTPFFRLIVKSLDGHQVDELLEKFVAELIPEQTIVFHGPNVPSVFGVSYVGLSSAVSESKIEAVAKYLVRFHETIGGAEQIAWRAQPRLEMKDGGYRVFSRLAVYRRPLSGEGVE